MEGYFIDYIIIILIFFYTNYIYIYIFFVILIYFQYVIKDYKYKWGLEQSSLVLIFS